jgi:hypothetical protein
MRLAICIATLAAVASVVVADEEVTHRLSASASRGSVRRVVVDIPPGEVSVRNGQADRISVTGEVRRDYDGYRQRDKQQQIVNDIDAQIELNGDEAVIRPRFGPSAQNWSARHHSDFRVTVEVPVGLDVDIQTRYGEMKLDGSFGNVDVDMGAGEIDLRTPRANVRELNASVRIGEVHANFGDYHESHEGILPGTTHFINAGGRSRVNLHTTVGEVHVTLR